MKSSLRQRATHTLYATGFGYSVSVLMQLVQVPLFLHFWGTEMYGNWLVLSTIPTYLSMGDLGLSDVAANDMTVSVGRSDRAAALKTFQSMLAVILVVSLATGVVTAGMIALEAEFRFLPVNKSITMTDLAIVIGLFWLQVAVALVSKLLTAGFVCDGNQALGVFLDNVGRLGGFAASAIVLFLGGGFVTVALASLITFSAGTCLEIIVIRRVSPWLRFGLRDGSSSEAKRLLRPALAFMGFPLGNALSNQGFVLAVSSMAGSAAVVIFSVHRTLSRLALQLSTMIDTSLHPELSRAFGQGEKDLLRRLHRLNVAGTFTVVMGGSLFLLVFGKPLMHFWTHGKVLFDSRLFLIFVAVALLNSTWTTSAHVSMSCNMHEKIALSYVIGVSGSLLASTLLWRIAGLRGIALALVLGDVFMIPLVFKRSMLLTDDRPVEFLRGLVAVPATVTVTLARSLRRSCRNH